MPGSTNYFLNGLPTAARSAVEPHLVPIDLTQEAILHEVGEPVKTIYFPESGLISLVALLQTGEAIEVAMIGLDGVAGGASALRDTTAVCRAVVQIAGKASTIDARTMRRIVRTDFAMQEAIARFDQLIFMQTVQSTACIAAHNVSARLAKWLLRCRDLTMSDELDLTQEFLGDMLAVRRASVSITANALQKAGLIKYARGHITITDPEGLREAACECYDVVRHGNRKMRRPSVLNGDL
jgi:CRP-like cAMP-binding protein